MFIFFEKMNVRGRNVTGTVTNGVYIEVEKTKTASKNLQKAPFALSFHKDNDKPYHHRFINPENEFK